MSQEEQIRRRVLRAIALNRTPGYHFPGNFIDLSFDRVASDDTRVSYESAARATSARSPCWRISRSARRSGPISIRPRVSPRSA